MLQKVFMNKLNEASNDPIFALILDAKNDLITYGAVYRTNSKKYKEINALQDNKSFFSVA